MKKLLKMLLALWMICALLFGEAAWAAAGGRNVSGGVSIAQRWNGAQIAARSRKKKNTAAPKGTAAPTARPEETPQPLVQPDSEEPTSTPVPEGPITDPQSIADWLFSHDMNLPENFITKKQAQALGWNSSYNYVSDVAPGKSIGGDYFGNYEEKLPTGKGISYHEADCYYTKGKRNAYRVIYSTDGRVWYTEDHYNSFTELFPTVPGSAE